jgi:hypothetical protein
MDETYREHPSEEALERFLLGMSAEEEMEDLETHVLACGYCVEQLEILEIQIAATRLALQTLEADRKSKRRVESFGGWKFPIPRWSFAAMGAAPALGAFFFFSLPRDVTISAYRGTETAIVSEWRPLHMHLNAAGLDAGAIEIELADNKGSIVWKGTSVIRHDTIDVTLPRITKSGAHYLRLYSPAQAGTESVLLREFALNAKWTM